MPNPEDSMDYCFDTGQYLRQKLATTIVPTIQEHCMAHIGELLKQARKKKELTQAEAAAKVGVSQGVLSQHESGSDMRVATLISYCKVYGIKNIAVIKFM